MEVCISRQLSLRRHLEPAIENGTSCVSYEDVAVMPGVRADVTLRFKRLHVLNPYIKYKRTRRWLHKQFLSVYIYVHLYPITDPLHRGFGMSGAASYYVRNLLLSNHE